MRRDDKQYSIQFSMDGWVQCDDLLHVHWWPSYGTVPRGCYCPFGFPSLCVELSDLSSRHEPLLDVGAWKRCYSISSVATTTKPSSNSMVWTRRKSSNFAFPSFRVASLPLDLAIDQRLPPSCCTNYSHHVLGHRGRCLLSVWRKVLSLRIDNAWREVWSRWGRLNDERRGIDLFFYIASLSTSSLGTKRQKIIGEMIPWSTQVRS